MAGQASSIGDSSNAAANLILNGTLRYIGTGRFHRPVDAGQLALRTSSRPAPGAVQFTNTGLVGLAAIPAPATTDIALRRHKHG